MGKIKTNKDISKKLNEDLAYLYRNGYNTSELTKISGVKSGATYNRIKKVVGDMRTLDDSKTILKTHPDEFEEDILYMIKEKGLYNHFLELYEKNPKPVEGKKAIKIKEDLLEKKEKYLEEAVLEDEDSLDGATIAELYQLSESLLENYYNFTKLEKAFISEDVILKVKDRLSGELKKYNDSNYKDFQADIKRIVISKSKKAILEKNITFSASLTEDEFIEAKEYMDNSLKVLETKFPTLKVSLYFRKRGKHIKLRMLLYNDFFNMK